MQTHTQNIFLDWVDLLDVEGKTLRCHRFEEALDGKFGRAVDPVEGQALDSSLVGDDDDTTSPLLLHGRQDGLDEPNCAERVRFKHSLSLVQRVALQGADEKNVGCYHYK